MSPANQKVRQVVEVLTKRRVRVTHAKCEARRMMMKLLRVVPVLVTLAVLAAACGTAPEPERIVETVVVEKEKEVIVTKEVEVEKQVVVTPTPEPEAPVSMEPKHGGTLVIAQAVEPFNLDSRLDPKMEGITALAQIQEGLLTKNLETGETIGGLAESWTMSPDETVYTFNLRKGVMFHDGTEFDSEDAYFTFEFLTGAREGSIYAAQYGPMIKSIEAPDKYTFIITLNTPWEDFESLLVNHWGSKILSKDAVESAGEGYGTETPPVGTGPFMYEGWVKGDHVTLVRNPDYWQSELPYLDAIVYKKVPDAPVRLLNVMSRDADIAFQPPLDQIPTVTKSPEFSAVCAPGNPQVFITFNTGVPPFSDPTVRQALFYGLDREALTVAVYGDYAYEAKDMFPAWHKNYDPNYPGVPYDPDKAKDLLAQAGYTESNPLSFELDTLAESEYEDLGVLIQAQLAEIGVQAELRPMESATLVAYRETDDWKADIGRYILPSTITDDYMWKQFGAAGTLNPMRYNQEGGYQHPEVESMILTARTSAAAESYTLYRQLVDLITEDAPRIRIAYKKNCQVTGPDVRNLVVQGTDAFPMKEVWLDR